MDFNKEISRSLKKSKKLSELQNIIWGSSRTLDPSVKDNTLAEYWDLCQGDKDISGLMQEYNISRETLNDIYMNLINAGVGQWVKGHFVALSALAYGEPFYYLLESQRRGQESAGEFKKLAYDILLYFKEEIPNGDLIRRLQLNKHPIKEQESSHLFCSHCKVKNLASHNFCTGCGKPLKVLSKVGSEVEENEIKNDRSFNLWEPLRVLLQITCAIIFIASFLTFINVISTTHANLGTLLQKFSISVGLTIIPWIIVLWLTKPFRKNIINRGAFLFSGFLGMVSLWIGYWLAYSLQIESPGLSKNPMEEFYVAIMLSPIWFVIGLLGRFKKPPIKKQRNSTIKTLLLLFLLGLAVVMAMIIYDYG